MNLEVKFKPFKMRHDYLLIMDWFVKRRFPVPLSQYLPKTGLIAFVEDVPIAAGFLFKTDARIASIGHLISNPDIDKTLRQKVVDHLLLEFSSLARDDGFSMVTCCTNIDPLMDRFSLHGFEKTDEGVSHFRRILCQ